LATRWKEAHVKALSVLLSVALFLWWYQLWPLKPSFKDIANAPTAHVAFFFLVVAVTAFAHEVLHLLPIRGAFGSKKTIIGVDVKNFAFYSYTDATASWGVCATAILLPFVVLTLIPTIVQFTMGLPSGWIGLAAICNASFSAVDLIIGTYIIVKIPRNALDVQPSITGISFLLPGAGGAV
jgi:hypothetical protein